MPATKFQYSARFCPRQTSGIAQTIHTMTGHSSLRKGRRSIRNQIYHVSTATNQWRPLFINIQMGRIVIDCMRHEHDAGHVESLAFVVMPDHLHWLFSLNGKRTLSSCVRNVKAFSSMRINRELNSKQLIWQRSFYDRAIRREEDLIDVARYIVANPLRAGLVRSIRDYPLWDCKWI